MRKTLEIFLGLKIQWTLNGQEHCPLFFCMPTILLVDKKLQKKKSIFLENQMK